MKSAFADIFPTALNTPQRHPWYAAVATEAPKSPKTYTMYVVRADTIPLFASVRHGETYIEVVTGTGFYYGLPLKRAQWFSTANAAARAIEERNRLNPASIQRFSIVPVKVTETPATTVEKVAEERVPAKTEYEIVVRGLGGFHSEEVLAKIYDGATWQFVRGALTPSRFATANEAATVIEQARGKPHGQLAEIRPVHTPATTVKKTILEYVPSATTVELA